MDLATACFLTTEDGARLLERARAVRDLPVHRRGAALGKRAPPTHVPDGLDAAALVRAALVQDDLRHKALARCPHAECMLFTREALEQATAWAVAEERATRWPLAPGPGAALTDLGAGLGFDALATAATGRPVRAWERDPVRALLLRHNARALGLEEGVRVETGDVLEARPAGPLALLDPGRRPGGRRTRDPESFEPPASTWEELLAPFAAAMVKLPPSAAADLATGPFEVVSLGGRVRETRRFVGPGWADAALPPRRALALPGGSSVEGPGRPWPTARAPREGDWLLDPDPAVVLAGLVGDLALDAGLAPVHDRIAYLLGPRPSPARPGHWVRVEACLPPRPKAVDAWLRTEGIGRLTVRARGVADDAATLRRRLHPRGPEAGTVVFTRGPDDRWVALGGRDVAEKDLPSP